MTCGRSSAGALAIFEILPPRSPVSLPSAAIVSRSSCRLVSALMCGCHRPCSAFSSLGIWRILRSSHSRTLLVKFVVRGLVANPVGELPLVLVRANDIRLFAAR